MGSHTRKIDQSDRKGNIIVMSSFLMVIMVGTVAFALDIGYMLIARTELQRTADAAALSASWDLITEGSFGGDPYLTQATVNARGHAVQYAGLNQVINSAPVVDSNPQNSANGDVVVGYLADFSNPSAALQLGNSSLFNAVSVRVRKSTSQNGSVPLSFARIFGWSTADMEAEATAALQTGFIGFQTPGDGSNLGILPIALDEDSWLDLVAGNGNDELTWDSATGDVKPYGDGIKEVNLYPEGTGSPGNRGMVDIGGNSNSTADISRQITDGVSPGDMAHHNGELKFDSNGELPLNGDTGISAGIKDELVGIIGQPRILPIFRTVSENGNNATYTIVKFVGVRLLEVDLTGNGSDISSGGKHVTIQPAPMVTLGGIPGSGPNANVSMLIYAPPRLVR